MAASGGVFRTPCRTWTRRTRRRQGDEGDGSAGHGRSHAWSGGPRMVAWAGGQTTVGALSFPRAPDRSVTGSLPDSIPTSVEIQRRGPFVLGSRRCSTDGYLCPNVGFVDNTGLNESASYVVPVPLSILPWGRKSSARSEQPPRSREPRTRRHHQQCRKLLADRRLELESLSWNVVPLLHPGQPLVSLHRPGWPRYESRLHVWAASAQFIGRAPRRLEGRAGRHLGATCDGGGVYADGGRRGLHQDLVQLRDGLPEALAVAEERGLEVVEAGRCPVFFMDGPKPLPCRMHTAAVRLTGTLGLPRQTTISGKRRELI